jgi:hypothetical protein
MTRICLLQNHVEVIAESRGLSRCDLFLKNMMLSALLSDNLFPWLGNEFASKLRRQSELISSVTSLWCKERFSPHGSHLQPPK